MTNYGLVIPTYQPILDAGRTAPELVETAVEAERLGLDSVWVGDTLARAPLDALTILAAFAARTSRVTLGTSALLPALRNPILTANQLLGIDLLSGGRLTVAVGAGFAGRSEPEFAFAGVPWERRRARLDDIVALWRAAWSGAKSFHGSVLHHDSLPEFPAPARPGGPPVWLAAYTPGALERVGRLYDGWLPYPPDPADYGAGLARIRATAARPVTPALFATVLVEADADRGGDLLEEYCLRNYGRPASFVQGIQMQVTGSAGEVAAQLRKYQGVEHFLLRIASTEPKVFDEQLPRVAEVVNLLRDQA
ncbi:Flavin-dependent oxidoreductase, luciferase family (includes alkanesulfonate monooxygenase SsuD and methylene tetrahydromethanopterin reductase) [Amycolatopsis tolypomycina]|uniref:Flavin-dependent oxidoreductase, luciferase family (Includes alkanesulfonate monooxygenase SsuD and methylene tetrahydromethanopterin reductase) n=1 Tax=Amycolatopsis tolypomycina TaxID=208445 RepID=A0A1H5CE60_9PSEU|nr:LLM class flavin-dependent oxidoreductase [Amycolatopsis tolypomycina]SED65002.1 Flavin-dependent oxidoreductase, luciferase family (includes alkanesulfonate monooxygenase SsuD and methylene tetrahydromethanopterin reductase) [Amycolatopsis tolypomycina]